MFQYIEYINTTYYKGAIFMIVLIRIKMLARDQKIQIDIVFINV